MLPMRSLTLLIHAFPRISTRPTGYTERNEEANWEWTHLGDCPSYNWECWMWVWTEAFWLHLSGCWYRKPQVTIDDSCKSVDCWLASALCSYIRWSWFWWSTQSYININIIALKNMTLRRQSSTPKWTVNQLQRETPKCSGKHHILDRIAKTTKVIRPTPKS